MEEKIPKNSKGFTLIELLVVISIIGLLASVVVTSLGSARAKARDARRLQDMHTIRVALELYYDTYGSYPNGNSDCGWDVGNVNESPDFFIPALEPDFISKVPREQWLNDDTSCHKYTYVYRRFAPSNTGISSWCGGKEIVLFDVLMETKSQPSGTGPLAGTCACNFNNNDATYAGDLCYSAARFGFFLEG